jgi:hypothetical protein
MKINRKTLTIFSGAVSGHQGPLGAIEGHRGPAGAIGGQRGPAGAIWAIPGQSRGTFHRPVLYIKLVNPLLFICLNGDFLIHLFFKISSFKKTVLFLIASLGPPCCGRKNEEFEGKITRNFKKKYREFFTWFDQFALS